MTFFASRSNSSLSVEKYSDSVDVTSICPIFSSSDIALNVASTHCSAVLSSDEGNCSAWRLSTAAAMRASVNGFFTMRGFYPS